MRRKFPKIIYFLVSFMLIFEQSGFAQIAAELNIAGHLSAMRSAFVQDKFRPVHLRYISYDNINNNFKLLLDKGDNAEVSPQAETQTLLKYFFIGISLPNDTFWVNLRPDSPDNIIDSTLAQTDLGKILLEADLQLKKDTAQFTSPATPEGKEYWSKLYEKAGELFGSENITIPTLTRPWIVPNEIIIRESADNAYIYKATLKVMLEQDYLKDSSTYNFSDARLKQLNEYSSQLIREKIIPKLAKEVNTSKRYAPLRQVYYSLILSQWFKQKFYGKGGLYSYLIDKKNLTGLISQESWSKDTYFQAYQKSFKEGEYNIKEQVYSFGAQTIRTYMSGGIALGAGEISRASSAITSNRGLPQIKFASSVVTTSGTIKNPFGLVEVQGLSSPVISLSTVTAQADIFLTQLFGTNSFQSAIGDLVQAYHLSGREAGFGIGANGNVEEVRFGSLSEVLNVAGDKGNVHVHPSRRGIFFMPSFVDVESQSAASHNNDGFVIIIWGDISVGFYATVVDLSKIKAEEYINVIRNSHSQNGYNINRIVDGLTQKEAVKFYRLQDTSINQGLTNEFNKGNKFYKFNAISRTELLGVLIRMNEGFDSITQQYYEREQMIEERVFEEYSSKSLNEIENAIAKTTATLNALRKDTGNSNYSQDAINKVVREQEYRLGGLERAKKKALGESALENKKIEAGSSPVAEERSAASSAVQTQRTGIASLVNSTKETASKLYDKYYIERINKAKLSQLLSNKNITNGISQVFWDGRELSPAKHILYTLYYAKANSFGSVEIYLDKVDLRSFGAYPIHPMTVTGQERSFIKEYARVNNIDLVVHAPWLSFVDDLGRARYPDFKEDAALYEQTLQFAEDVGAKIITLHLGNPNDIDSAIDFVKKAAKKNLVVAIENAFYNGHMEKEYKDAYSYFVESNFHSGQEFAVALEKIRAGLSSDEQKYLAITFDIAHANISGDPLEFYQAIKSTGIRIANVHINQNDGKTDQHKRIYASEGGIPLAKFLEILIKDNGANNRIIVNQEINDNGKVGVLGLNGKFKIQDPLQLTPSFNTSSPVEMNRRDFLKTMGGAAGAAAVALNPTAAKALDVLSTDTKNSAYEQYRIPSDKAYFDALKKGLSSRFGTIADSYLKENIAYSNGNNSLKFISSAYQLLTQSGITFNKPYKILFLPGIKTTYRAIVLEDLNLIIMGRDLFQWLRPGTLERWLAIKILQEKVRIENKDKTLLEREEAARKATLEVMGKMGSLPNNCLVVEKMLLSAFEEVKGRLGKSQGIDYDATRQIMFNKKTGVVSMPLELRAEGKQYLLPVGTGKVLIGDTYPNDEIDIFELQEGFLLTSNIAGGAFAAATLNSAEKASSAVENKTALLEDIKKKIDGIVLVDPYNKAIEYKLSAEDLKLEDKLAIQSRLVRVGDGKKSLSVVLETGINKEGEFSFALFLHTILFNGDGKVLDLSSNGFGSVILSRVSEALPLGIPLNIYIVNQPTIDAMFDGRHLDLEKFKGTPMEKLLSAMGFGGFSVEGKDVDLDVRNGEVFGFTLRAVKMQTASSAVEPQEIKTPGGIDFRALPAVVQPIPLLKGQMPIGVTPKIPLSELSKEWEQIENMLNAGVAPSADRVKDYLQSCYQGDDYNQDVDKVLSCIADILRLEEVQVVATDLSLKQMLVLLETNKPAGEMQLALANITVESKEPKALKE